MRWVPVRRATLLIPSGPASDPTRKHLHIVLNDPYPDPTGTPKVLVVSVSSIPPNNIYDPSCTIFPGEHPFVVVPSYVSYQFASLQVRRISRQRWHHVNLLPNHLSMKKPLAMSSLACMSPLMLRPTCLIIIWQQRHNEPCRKLRVPLVPGCLQI